VKAGRSGSGSEWRTARTPRWSTGDLTGGPTRCASRSARTTSGGGIDYRHDLSDLGLPGLEAARFAYDVYFPEDFEFVGDGKFGGLGGITDGLEPLETSAGGTYDERSFSVRAMWKEDRGVVMYLYARQAAGRDFDDPEHFGYGIPERFVGPDGRTEDILTPGRWHRVEHRVTLNTPGSRTAATSCGSTATGGWRSTTSSTARAPIPTCASTS
jgi:hypothetical protein